VTSIGSVGIAKPDRSGGVAALRRPFDIIARISDLVQALNSRLLGAGLKAQRAVRRRQPSPEIIAGRCGTGEEGAASPAP
jgi:hypothetical protein